ncbi:hypothetical protein GCM10027569_38430 [Flindersiella endophytica]
MARIAPTDDEPVWGIHVASTGSVEVNVSWQEWGDAAEPTPATAMVAQLNVPRGTEKLPQLSHDFGDTKQRRVGTRRRRTRRTGRPDRVRRRGRPVKPLTSGQ